MTSIFKNNNIFLLGLILFGVCMSSKGQSYTYTIRNDVQTSDRTFEFDIYILNTDKSVPIEIALAQAGILLNPSIINGGNITASFVEDASEMSPSQKPSSITFQNNCIKIACKPIPSPGNGTLVSTKGPGTRLCRVRLTNTVPFYEAKPDLTFNFTPSPYNTVIGKFRSESAGIDALPIDATRGFSCASNQTLSSTSSIEKLSDFPYTLKMDTNGFHINVGDKESLLKVYSLNGQCVLSKQVFGKSYVNMKLLKSAIYIVEVNGYKTKVSKK
jgi:hypothetical protein